METKPLTIGEIAQHCHVTHRAVLKWIASDKLKAYRTPGKHGRVEVGDFLQFLAKYKMPVPPELLSAPQTQKILIVDDDKEMAHAIMRALMPEKKFDIRIAYDGFEAGEIFGSFKPDLMTLDIRMAGLDGYRVCSRIRNDLKNKNVKILVISGILDEEKIRQIMTLGADDYLPKPFDNQALKLKIEKLLSPKREEESR